MPPDRPGALANHPIVANPTAPIANRIPPAVVMTAPTSAAIRPRPRTRWRTPSPTVRPMTANAKPSISMLGQAAPWTFTRLS